MVNFKRFGRSGRVLIDVLFQYVPGGRVKPRKLQDKRCAGQVLNGALLNISRYANPLVLFPCVRLKFQSIVFVIRKILSIYSISVFLQN